MAFTRLAITVPMSEAEIFTALRAGVGEGNQAHGAGPPPSARAKQGLGGTQWWVCRAGAQTTSGAALPPPPRLGEGQHSQGTYLATSLKVFFLVMPAPLAVLPFQGSGYGE